MSNAVNQTQINATYSYTYAIKLLRSVVRYAIQVPRRYSSYSLLTSALDGDEWSASRLDRALPPRKGPPVPIG
jgi:hypothetical protein